MEVTEGQIENLISLGYDLHIHDTSGLYPEEMGREEWEQSEKNKILKGAGKDQKGKANP